MGYGPWGSKRVEHDLAGNNDRAEATEVKKLPKSSRVKVVTAFLTSTGEFLPPCSLYPLILAVWRHGKPLKKLWALKQHKVPLVSLKYILTNNQGEATSISPNPAKRAWYSANLWAECDWLTAQQRLSHFSRNPKGQALSPPPAPPLPARPPWPATPGHFPFPC